MEDYFKELEKLENALKEIPEWSNLVQEQWNIANSVSSESYLQNNQSDILGLISDQSLHQASQLSRMCSNELQINTDILADTLATQMQTFYSIGQNVLTPDISTLIDNFQNANWMDGINNFISNISVGYTQAANLALLKNVKALGDLTTKGYTNDIKQLLKKMQKKAGECLAETDRIEVSVSSRIFRPIDNIDASADIEVINVSASSREIFPELTIEELIGLTDILSNEPEFASSTEAGKKIDDAIESWKDFINFDRDYYYHGRTMKENEFWFTSDEMRQAPDDCVESGRYNHMRQSHYYVADTARGAESEIKIHKKDAKVQVARLRPKKRIRMIDLSQKVSGKNLFLSSLRYTADPGDKTHKEYLIPQFVTTCCKRSGIEGIKYYGSKEYNNYVTWSDYYFEVTDPCWSIG